MRKIDEDVLRKTLEDIEDMSREEFVSHFLCKEKLLRDEIHLLISDNEKLIEKNDHLRERADGFETHLKKAVELINRYERKYGDFKTWEVNDFLDSLEEKAE